MLQKYIKINIASPSKILKWTERNLPNKELIGEITNSIRYIKKSLKYINFVLN